MMAFAHTNSNSSNDHASSSSTAALGNNGSSSSSSVPDDRFVFVLVVDEHQQQVWWPAMTFPNSQELARELPLWVVQPIPIKVRMFRELLAFFQRQKQQQQQLDPASIIDPTVAYLLGSSLPPGSSLIMYQCPRHPLLASVTELAPLCVEYPGWTAACEEALDLYGRVATGATVATTTTTTANTTSSSSLMQHVTTTFLSPPLTTTATTTATTMPTKLPPNDNAAAQTVVAMDASVKPAATTFDQTTTATSQQADSSSSNLQQQQKPTSVQQPSNETTAPKTLEPCTTTTTTTVLPSLQQQPPPMSLNDSATSEASLKSTQATDDDMSETLKPAARTTVPPLTATMATTTTTTTTSSTKPNDDVSQTTKLPPPTVVLEDDKNKTKSTTETKPETNGVDPSSSPMECEPPPKASDDAAAALLQPSSESATTTVTKRGDDERDDDEMMKDSVEIATKDSKDDDKSPMECDDDGDKMILTPDSPNAAEESSSASSSAESPPPPPLAKAVVKQKKSKKEKRPEKKKQRAPPAAEASTPKPKTTTTGKKRKPGNALHPTTTTKKAKASASASKSLSPRLLGLVTPPDHDRHEHIPTFQQVKPFLLRAECSFQNGMFALPKQDPQTNASAVLGRDYFTTLAEFRTNLCQFGLDNDFSWDEAERDMLNTWIRYDIVTCLKEGDKVPAVDALDNRQAWLLLRKLGFTFAMGGYLKPNVDRKHLIEVTGPLQTKFRDRLGHDGLYAHLARFGLPADTKKALTRKELLSLQLYMATGDDPNTFERLSDGNFSLTSGSATTTCGDESLASPAATIQEDCTTQETEFDSQSSTPSTARRVLALSEPDTAQAAVPDDDSPMPDVDDDQGSSKSNQAEQPPPLSPDQPELPVPTFDDARPLLENVGFVFRESLYARPGMDPSVNNSAEKGKDYFDSEDEFRKHLCAYGIGVDRSRFNDHDGEILEDWVRFAIVTSFQGKTTIHRHQQLLTKGLPWKLLMKMGYTFSTAQYSYLPPGVNAHTMKIPEPGPCRNQFNDVSNKDGLYNHLARFGIEGDASKLSPDDLLSLELFIASSHVDSVFDTKVDGVDHLSLSRSTRVRTAAAMAPEPKARAKGTSSGPASGSSPFDNDAVAECQRNSRGSGNGRAVGRNIMSQLNSCTNDTKMTVGAKLSACLEALQGSFKLKSLSVLPSSRFQNQISDIDKFVSNITNSKVRKPNQEVSLYVCGSPGVGKTCSILWCCGKAIEDARAQSNDDSDIPVLCHLNLGHLITNPNGMNALMEAMAEALGTTTNKVLKTLDVKSKYSRKLILILDEIDVLVQERGARSSGKEKILENISNWIDNPDLSLALIGISNSVGNPRFVRLNSICKFHKKITFEPYGKQDLVNLVHDRIGKTVVDPRALEFAAAKISATTGDAREMLILTAGAVQKCLHSLSDKDADSPYSDTAPVVKMANMMLANRETIKQYADIVDGLPQMAKAVLCVAVTFAQNGSGETLFSLGGLRRHCLDCLQWEDEGFGIESFRDFVQQLVDAGLLKIQGAAAEEYLNANVNQLHNVPISLSLQLQDVESVLETNLEEREFYRGIMERAREISRRLKM